jgi:hypothetical protein
MLINYGKCGIGAIRLNLEVIGKCTRCGKDAIINLPYAKQKLCIIDEIRIKAAKRGRGKEREIKKVRSKRKGRERWR